MGLSHRDAAPAQAIGLLLWSPVSLQQESPKPHLSHSPVELVLSQLTPVVQDHQFPASMVSIRKNPNKHLFLNTHTQHAQH